MARRGRKVNNTSRPDSGSILIIQNNEVFTKDFTSCDPWLLTVW